MSDVVGRGVIELVADARKLQAGIEDAKKSIRTLGEGQKDISKSASASIDNYIGRLKMQQQTLGKSTRETELFKLAMRGASNEQLKAADSALKLTEAYERGVVIGDKLKTGFMAFGAVAATGLIAAAAAFDHLAKSAGDFQDMAEKTGDTAENIASLAVAAAVGGVQMDAVVGAANRLTKGLTGVDDESKAAGAAIQALGLNLDEFKQLSPTAQFESVAKALDKFQDGASKSAVTMALFGKSGSEMLPFLKELAGETGRQNILTEAQIKLADEYADRQKRLATQISLHAQAIVTELLPAYTDIQGATLDFIKKLASAKEGVDGLGEGREIQLWADNTTKALMTLNAPLEWLIKKFHVMGVLSAGLADIATSPIQQTMAKYAVLDARISSISNAKSLSENIRDRINARNIGEQSAKDPSNYGNEGRSKPRANNPKLEFEGASKDKSSELSALAKSQLELDLAQIRSASEKVTGIYSNAEKIMEATRSAGLIEERDYYAAKLGFLTVNAAAQEVALQKELARMQSEKLSGKEKLDNEKKIIETEDKLNKLRETAAASATVLGIQESAALKKIELGYRDAEAAAQAFFDGIARGNARQLVGIGAGTKERDRTAGRAQIEDKYSEEIRQLNQKRQQSEFAGTFGADAQAKYDDELSRIKRFQEASLSEYDKYYAARTRKEGDWSLGAAEAMQNYYTESRNIMKQTEEVFTNAFRGMENALVDFVMTGKADFSSLAKSIIADITRIMVRQAMSNDMGVSGSSGGRGLAGMAVSAISAYFGGSDSVTLSDGSSFGSAMGGRAIGGPVSAGGMYQVNEKGTPELLNVAGKQYLMMGNQPGTVDATGGGSGGVNVSVAVDATGSSAEGDTQKSKQLGQMIGGAVRSIILQEKRAGGILA